jgi:hypothetical protein
MFKLGNLRIQAEKFITLGKGRGFRYKVYFSVYEFGTHNMLQRQHTSEQADI